MKNIQYMNVADGQSDDTLRA